MKIYYTQNSRNSNYSHIIEDRQYDENKRERENCVHKSFNIIISAAIFQP